MGLYINENKHADIYKNGENIQEPNQDYFIKNHVSEMIREQQQINESLERSFHQIKNMHEQREYQNGLKLENIGKQLQELQEMKASHEVMESQVMKQLRKLETDYQQLQLLVEEGRLSDKDTKERLEQLTISNENISGLIQEVRQKNEKIAVKIDSQSELQGDLSEQIAELHDSTGRIIKRLDHQEAFSEKLNRQMDYFRSLLFERTNHLTEKLEQMSSYIISMLSGSDELQTNYVIQKKQREKENSHR